MYKSISITTNVENAYTYYVGAGLLEKASSYISRNFGRTKLLLVIDKNVYQHHITRLLDTFEPAFDKILTYVVPAGEKSKSFEQFTSIVDLFLNEKVERNTPVLAIGGGVIGDLTGYVASSVLRGLPLIHMPTSLLAMVDSSIGGKTGINHSTGKNLIGAFYQPKAVFADIEFLETLPPKEWVNGLSEIIKYGMIESGEILDELKSLTAKEKFAAPGKWIDVIEKSAQIKVDIVQKDVHEGGVRAFLNFGHTYGHVIERAGGYNTFSHGEAVFAGMYGAISASNVLGHSISEELLDHFFDLYKLNISDLPPVQTLIEWMSYDKKVNNEQVRLVLLEEIGKPFVHVVEDQKLLQTSWNRLLERFS